VRFARLCRELGRQLLLSSEFVRTGGVAAQSVGTFSLKGVGADQEIFAPIE
jgi:adenylate cyclase